MKFVTEEVLKGCISALEERNDLSNLEFSVLDELKRELYLIEKMGDSFDLSGSMEEFRARYDGAYITAFTKS